MDSTWTRRDVIGKIPLALGAGLAAGATSWLPASKAVAAPFTPRSQPFRFCLNTSTIRGQKVPLEQEVDLAAEVGYDAIEPWIREIDDYVKAGGSLPDLAKRIQDKGLTVDSAIGFFDWAVDDPERRRKGLEEGRRSMDLVRQLGGTRIAAPPTGVTDQEGMSLDVLATRFRAAQDLGAEMGVVPQIEVWGFSKTLTTLAQSTYVALASGHPDACLLPDVYHLYKGGSPFETLDLLSGQSIHVFHMNDYPDIPRAEIKDEHRVYPGDGVAPLGEILRSLRAAGFAGTLSLELFNRDYWQKDAKLVARTGLEKMRTAVEKAFA